MTDKDYHDDETDNDELEGDAMEESEYEENRLREATAIQVYPSFLQMCASGKKNVITQQIEGVHIDVVRAATMAWQAAEALVGVGKATNKGRVFTSDQTKQPEPKGIIQ